MNSCFLSMISKRSLRIGLALSLVSVCALFSSYHLIFDLLANFRVQYVVLIFMVLCLALINRAFFIAWILVACLAVHATEITRSQLSQTIDSESGGTSIRILSSNLHASNSDYNAQIEFIKSINPDVIVFQEYTYAWESALSGPLNAFKYRVAVPSGSPFGIALYSKWPLDDTRTLYLTNADIPSVEGTVIYGSETLKVFGTHPPPPISIELYRQRNQHLLEISKLSRDYSKPFIVAGDLNITPWSSHFKSFLAQGNLNDGRRGFGVLPTWPSTNLPLQIPIDHIITNDRVQVRSLSTSDGLTSDHKSIWADVRVR